MSEKAETFTQFKCNAKSLLKRKGLTFFNNHMKIMKVRFHINVVFLGSICKFLNWQVIFGDITRV